MLLLRCVSPLPPMYGTWPRHITQTPHKTGWRVPPFQFPRCTALQRECSYLELRFVGSTRPSDWSHHLHTNTHTDVSNDNAAPGFCCPYLKTMKSSETQRNSSVQCMTRQVQANQLHRFACHKKNIHRERVNASSPKHTSTWPVCLPFSMTNPVIL